MERVDVLGILDAIHGCPMGHIHATNPATGEFYSDELLEARAAVAELIKCSDVTIKAFEALGRTNNIAAQLECHRECERALIEQKAALARITKETGHE